MNELVVHSGAGTEDIFFGQVPHVTNWDEVYSNVDTLNVDKLVAECHTMEPLKATDVNDHRIWVLQQKIRIALRLNAKMPFVTDKVCASCASHFVDPIYHTCLWCAEYGEQIGYRGGRGSCEFINSVYDVRSRSWGLLYYWSHSNDTYMFWLAIGFKSHRAAELSLYPLSLYEDWLKRKYNSLYSEWRIAARMFGISEMMKTALPWYPEDLEKQLRDRIRADMHEEHNLLSYYISHAQDDYDRDHRNAD